MPETTPAVGGATPAAPATSWEAVLDQAVASGAIVNGADLPREDEPREPPPLTQVQIRDLFRIAEGRPSAVHASMKDRLQARGLLNGRCGLTEEASELLIAMVAAAPAAVLPPVPLLPLGQPFFVTVADVLGGYVAVEKRTVARRWPVPQHYAQAGAPRWRFRYMAEDGIGFADDRASAEETEVYLFGSGPGRERSAHCDDAPFPIRDGGVVPGRTRRAFLTRAAADAYLRPIVERLRAACTDYLGD